MSNTTTIIRARCSEFAGCNHMYHLECQVADLYNSIRHQMGPEAPACLLEIEGAHRNRSARIEQFMRENLIVPFNDEKSGSKMLQSLEVQLAQVNKPDVVLDLLHALECELASTYDNFDKSGQGEKKSVENEWLIAEIFPCQRKTIESLNDLRFHKD